MARHYLIAALRVGTAAAAIAAASPAFAQVNTPAPPPAAPAPATSDVEPQNAADQPAPQNGDIIITARRRSENLRDVPIAVTAYTGEQLERRGAVDITDVERTTPNVTLHPSRGTNSTLTAFIRGVGQQDPVAGFEAGVGIYLDDVYLNRPQAAVLDIYDVDRIEVLRGPQGTLYGRNTIGGAVKYVTRRLPRDPSLRGHVTVGNYDELDVVASASLPVDEARTFRVGGSIARLSRGGFGRNLTTGLSNYNKNIWAGRLSAEFEPSPQAFFRLTGDYTKDLSNARGGHRLIVGYQSGAPILSNVFDTQGGLNDPRQKIKAYGASLHGEFKPVDGLTLRSITSFRKDESGTPIDFDALPAVDVDVPAIYQNQQFSQELQAVINRGPLSGVVGAYYLSADAFTAFDVRLFTTVNGLTAFTQGSVGTDTTALFADFTYKVTPQVELSLGGRYTWDRRNSTILRQTLVGGGSPLFGGAGVVAATQTNFNGSSLFKKFTPRASLSFKPTPDHNLYVSYSEGFKGGGFDPRGVGTNAPSQSYQDIFNFLSFKPERVTSYEAGYKASLLDRRVNLALAVFDAEYKDVQIPGSRGCTVVVNGVPQQQFCGITTNAGRSRFRGVEFEGNAVLARDFASAGDRLSLAGSLGYLDAKYRQYITNIPVNGVNTPVDVAAFRRVQNTPKWTVSGTLDYGANVAGGRLDLLSTVSYRSKVYQFEIPTPALDQPGFVLWDASLVWNAPGDRWTIGIHGKNLTNKKYITSGYVFMAADPVTGVLLTNAQGRYVPTLGKEGVLTAFYGNPRQVLLTVGFNF
jgi:iron complex outermembrane receptor protein